MSEINHDIVILGAGPGGYVAAIAAAQKGFKVGLVEQKEVGGVCLQAGCIPTKTWLGSIDVLRAVRNAGSFGISTGAVEVSYPAISVRRQKIVTQFTQGIQFLLRKNQVELIRGKGTLNENRGVDIVDADGKTTRTLDNSSTIVLATGSRPINIPCAPRDGQKILNSGDALLLDQLPKDLVIIGGGYIGCELAGFYAPLGCQVTLVEALDRLLPNMDKDLGQIIARSLAKLGVRILLNTRVEKTAISDDVELTLGDGQTIKGEKVIVAVGRQPNVEDLGLEKAGVRFSSKGIEVNEHFQTNVSHIYAIGDGTGKMALAHVASAQARRVVSYLTSLRDAKSDKPVSICFEKPLDYQTIPACVFTHPEIGSAGLSEEAAVQQGFSIRVGRFPFSAMAKAAAMGETDGFVKLIAEANSGKLLGAHIVGGACSRNDSLPFPGHAMEHHSASTGRNRFCPSDTE